MPPHPASRWVIVQSQDCAPGKPAAPGLGGTPLGLPVHVAASPRCLGLCRLPQQTGAAGHCGDQAASATEAAPPRTELRHARGSGQRGDRRSRGQEGMESASQENEEGQQGRRGPDAVCRPRGRWPAAPLNTPTSPCPLPRPPSQRSTDLATCRAQSYPLMLEAARPGSGSGQRWGLRGHGTSRPRPLARPQRLRAAPLTGPAPARLRLRVPSSSYEDPHHGAQVHPTPADTP